MVASSWARSADRDEIEARLTIRSRVKVLLTPIESSLRTQFKKVAISCTGEVPISNCLLFLSGACLNLSFMLIIFFNLAVLFYASEVTITSRIAAALNLYKEVKEEGI